MNVQYEKMREKTWKKRGILCSMKIFLQKLIKQNYKCEICKCVIDTSAHLDHNHKNGLIRGLLCNKCNLLLGYAQDDINILQSAIHYLRKYDI